MSYDNKTTEEIFCSCPKSEKTKETFYSALFLMEFSMMHIIQLQRALFENEINLKR